MVNRVILIGNLGRDPEVRRLENGAVVAKFSVATNENYKDRSGEWQTQTEWHDVVVWRSLAERAEQQLKKATWLCRFDRIQRIEQKELQNKIPGLFYNEKRRHNFLQRKVQFVSKGKDRNGLTNLNKDQLKMALEIFEENMIRCGYQEMIEQIKNKLKDL